MNQLTNIFQNVQGGFSNEEITTPRILTMLLMVAIFSFYEFIIYRYISKRSFYSKHFNISLAVIPFFIASIIMSLQTSLVVSLGTIGALAIIRFRTAVKDPLDMVYLFWSVHTGIVVGIGLYEAAFLTSIAVTVFILVLDFIPLGRAPYLLVLNIDALEDENKVTDTIRQYASNVTIKSRNFSPNGIDIIAEIRSKQENALMKEIINHPSVTHASLVAHDGEKEF